MTDQEYAVWSLTEEGKTFLAKYITSTDADMMEHVLGAISNSSHTNPSSDAQIDLTSNLGIEDTEQRKTKRSREDGSIENHNPHTLNSTTTHNNPIYQAEENKEYGEIPTEHMMEYQSSNGEDNRARAIHSSATDLSGTNTQIHYGNPAIIHQMTALSLQRLIYKVLGRIKSLRTSVSIVVNP
ncbi:uncharacterized protein LOC113335327 isoform X1 [Papaver somniferum]|uniref:uncharacterized protein LOC113335327 isoform X1 n=1 Tax=Papaver somniferum TaxID=3469 RepID=UPI000E70020B|nr:uncharacterized protein LOC113335327 isoform X1 [Papaver somniferum]